MQDLKYKPLAYRIAVGLLFFNQGIVFSAWATRIPDFKTALGLSEADLGSVLFAIPLGQISVMLLSGWLVAKFSSFKVVRLAAYVYPLTLFLPLLAYSKATLFAALYCFGIAANLTNISINTQAVDVERIYGRSVMSSFHGLWSFAGFCGGVISALLTGFNVGVLPHYIGVNVFVILALVCACRYFVPFDFAPQPKGDDAGKTRSIWRPTPYILFLGVIAFSCMSCEGTMFDWSVIFFRDVVGTAPDVSRIGFVAFMSAMATGRFVGDFLINKFGYLAVLRTSGVLISAGMFTAVLFPNAFAGAAGFLLVGCGVSSVVPTCYSLAGRSRRMSSGIAIAVVSTVGFFGFLIFPPLIGYIAHISSLRFSFALMGCIGIMVSLVSPALRSRIEN